VVEETSDGAGAGRNCDSGCVVTVTAKGDGVEEIRENGKGLETEKTEAGSEGKGVEGVEGVEDGVEVAVD
jgi:hypothetical protein